MDGYLSFSVALHYSDECVRGWVWCSSSPFRLVCARVVVRLSNPLIDGLAIGVVAAVHAIGIDRSSTVAAFAG